MRCRKRKRKDSTVANEILPGNSPLVKCIGLFMLLGLMFGKVEAEDDSGDEKTGEVG